MSDSVEVSIIMSVYNDESYVAESIESILNQTYENWEFIIVNDCSTDNTPEILEKYQKKDNRIKIVHNKNNLGLTRSLNVAISLAEGKYIARQDSDDISLPERLEMELAILEQHPDIGLVGTRYQEIDENGSVVRDQRVKFVSSWKDIKKQAYHYNPFAHSSVLIRRECLDNVGYYNENYQYSQDYELWFRLIDYSKAVNLDEVLLYRRYAPDMISTDRAAEQHLCMLRAKLSVFRDMPFSAYVFLAKDLLKYVLLKTQNMLNKYTKGGHTIA